MWNPLTWFAKEEAVVVADAGKVEAKVKTILTEVVDEVASLEATYPGISVALSGLEAAYPGLTKYISVLVTAVVATSVPAAPPVAVKVVTKLASTPVAK